MWEVKINVLNILQKLAKVTATRTDPVTDEVYTYSCTAILDTPAQRSAVLDQIKDNYLAHVERKFQAESVIAGLEATATNALNVWEETL